MKLFESNIFYFIYIGALYSALLYFVIYRSKKTNYNAGTALDISFILMFFGFLGARLTHVIYENPEIYRDHFFRIFEFWYGGFVFFGGAITAGVAIAIFLRLKSQPFLPWADFFSPIGALGYGLGRISCLISGCCYGKTCELPWAIHGLHPTQIYASITELLTFLILLKLEKIRRKPGFIFFTWIAMHGAGRLVMEYFRDDFRGPQILNMSLSGFLSLILLSSGIVGALAKKSFFGKTHP